MNRLATEVEFTETALNAIPQNSRAEIFVNPAPEKTGA